MTAIAFDTLKFVRTLKDAQFDDRQAEAISRAFRDAQDESEVATRADIREIDNKLDQLRSEIHSQIREVELRFTIRMGAMIATAIAILVAIDRFLQTPAI
uniref:DUF1640 domain-containing protein n=1 Tax=Candidatus Kentrum sp. FM TaxID=2126340 RepID=A0A450WT42_9GAMM|nr:MAG: hypothetical protein BECKFM1743A_GA0114220_101893 [Candidatus Kentron sp. FM]VFJ72896.1 MAG: hypothetical protein BECKFM1743C_GA0114222_106822 [Candidatus Kentron sp. FM]VFK20168.1 MAG: hypothetical protein BECKFM1743B_GA0114221_106754 [Candidatus Kentron sp. FM]